MGRPMQAPQRTQAPLTIRAMAPEDAKDVAQLCGQLGYGRSETEVRLWLAEHSGKQGGTAAFVACIESQVLGWIEVSAVHHVQSPPCALIGGLVVREGHRSAGLGRLLCERAEQWSREHGMDRIRVTSRSIRGDAHRFYLRQGYELVKTSQVFERVLGDL